MLYSAVCVTGLMEFNPPNQLMNSFHQQLSLHCMFVGVLFAN